MRPSGRGLLENLRGALAQFTLRAPRNQIATSGDRERSGILQPDEAWVCAGRYRELRLDAVSCSAIGQIDAAIKVTVKSFLKRRHPGMPLARILTGKKIRPGGERFDALQRDFSIGAHKAHLYPLAMDPKRRRIAGKCSLHLRSLR